MPALSSHELEARATAVALEAATVGAGEAASPRRAVPARPGRTEWNRVHLRLLYDQPFAVYDPLGEMELLVDEHGVLRALSDPRNAPADGAIHTSEQQAMDAVLHLMGASGEGIELMAELQKTRDGNALLKVRNRAARAGEDRGKFFQRKEEEAKPAGPLPDRIAAEVNASTGRIYRFSREPAPPPEGAP